MDEGEVTLERDGGEEPIDEVAVGPGPETGLEAGGGTGLFEDEILKGVLDPLGGACDSGETAALPFEGDFGDAQGAEVKSGNFRVQKLLQGGFEWQSMVAAEPDAGIKQDVHHRAAGMLVRRD